MVQARPDRRRDRPRRRRGGGRGPAAPVLRAAGEIRPDQRRAGPHHLPTQQHRPYSPPPVLRSAHGVLETTFTVRPTTFRVAGKQVRGLAYQGGFMGPTLRVRPGDTVRIHLRNQLGEPTNLHSHGMYVSPIGISDNVLRTMKAHSNNDFVARAAAQRRPGHVLVPHPPARTDRGAGLRRPVRSPRRRGAPAPAASGAARRPRAASWRSRTCRSSGAPSSGTASTPTHRRPGP